MYELDGNLFDWDPIKALANLQKHKVAFKEAATVFLDEEAIYFDDTRHSAQEERFSVIGRSKIERLLMVCHCYREKGNDTIIRIISARQATKSEEELYGGVE